MAPLGLLIFAFSAFLFRGVESQPMSCFVQNPCTGTPETTTHEDCCSLERLSGIPENCGERADDACNIYYRVSGEPCDPCQIIGFENSTITLTESGPQTIPIKLFSLGLIEIILLTASITSTNATENVDYSFTSQMFDYLRRVPSDTDIDIDIINDNIALEPIEVIDISLINRGFIDIFGPHDTTIIIIDDDVLTIAANPSFFEVQEGGSISFTLSKDKETAVPVDITVTPLTYQQYSNKTATNNNLPSLSSITNAPSNPAEEQDFNSTAIQLRTGNSSGSFPVSMNGLVTDDTIVEDPEGFVLLIESTNPDPRIRFNNQIIVIQINNDDTLSLMFDQSTLRLSENGGSLSLSILPQAGVMSELTNTVINYQVTPSLAGDVTFLPANSLVFDGTSAVLRITPIDDQTLEDIKTAIITFQPASNESGIQFSPTNSVNVIITDDENVTLSLISDSTFVSEGSSFNVCVSVTEPNDVAPHFIPVSLTLIPYLPTQEGDYSTMDSNLSPILTQRNRSTCFLIDTDEDQMTEEDEMFGVSIALQSVAEADFFRSRTSFNPPVLNLTIINDDSVTIGFTMESISVVEGSNPVSICFRVNEGILARNVAVNVSSSSNTAVIGVDYSLPSSVFIFNSSVNEHCVSFVPLEDDIIENTETVTVLLSTSDPAVNFDISRETVSITDNDRASIDFSQAEFTIREDGSTLSYSVILTGNLDRSIVVSVNDIPGTATRDVDYSNVSETITFTNSSKRFTGVLRIINDSIVETTETLILALSSSDPFVDLVNATVSISDSASSRVTVGFLPNSWSLIEGATVIVSLRVIEGTLARNMSLNMTIVPSTGSDFNIVPDLSESTFTFKGLTYQLLIVTFADNILEGNEEVLVSVSSTDPSFISDGPLRVTIEDANRVRVEFSQTSLSLSEDAGTVSVCASLILVGNTRELAIPVSADAVVVNETAFEFLDFTFDSKVFSFSTNSLTSCVNMSIIKDTIIESAERFSLTLRTSTPGALIEENAVMNITLIEDDVAVFEFTRPSYAVNEGESVEICVGLSNNVAIQNDVSIIVSSEGIEATDGVDYPVVNQTLTYRQGGPDPCFNVSPISDSRFESAMERFRLRMRSSSPLVAASDTAIVAITDTDVMGLIFPTGTQEVSEGEMVSVCVTPNITTDISFTVPVNATGITATYPSDFTPQQLSITVQPFSSGMPQFCSSLSIIDDPEAEQDETIALALVPMLSSRIVPAQSSMYTLIIKDNDEFGVTCNINSTQWVSTFNGTARYLFDRNCEHKLVSSCNSSRIDIRVDFLNRTLSSGLIAIMHDEQKIVFSAYSVTSRPAPSVSNISIIQQVDSVTVTLNSIGLSVNFSKNAVTVVVFGDALMMRLNGLCGALNGDLVYSDCQRTANFMNRTSVSEFITSHFVEAPEQLARPNREECGIIRNDTAQGDPLFTVPILYTRVANLTGPLHLCYEIHGRPDTYFNYISDDCTSVTAHYVQSTNAPIYNIIDSISIVAIDSTDHCHQIQVNSNGCTATYDGVSITRNSPGPGSNDIRSPFSHRGISIRRYSDRVRIKVPNCADVSLVMWVVCETVNISDPYTGVNLGPVTMIKFTISRGFNLHEYSHGLIGQFWNIPINVSSFNGVSTYPPRFNNLLYTVSINHPVDPQRQFVGLLYRSWTQRGTSCLHVGNKQAGKIREIESPNDPVIRGTYTDYEVSGPFDTQFVYSVFKRSDSC